MTDISFIRTSFKHILSSAVHISQDDEIEFEAWLEHFIGCVDDDIYSCNPLNDCDIDVNSSWEAL